MAQHDVYAKPSRSATEGNLFVVDIQSDLLEALPTRLTIPLATPTSMGKVPGTLCPVVVVEGQKLHAPAHHAAPLPAKLLRRRVTNRGPQAPALVAAIDFVLSGG